MSDIWQIVAQISTFDAGSVASFSPWVIFLILFFTTFLTEDGACLLAGALAADGTVSLGLAVAACFAGIFVGDVGLYWIGRLSGGSLARSRIFGRYVKAPRLERASKWLEKRGLAAIFISRFITGLRLPTYLAAGFLRTNFLTFAFYFLIAAAVWTPLLVISASYARQMLIGGNLLVAVIVLFIAVRLVLTLSIYRRRRLFVGRIKKIWKWEFWPLSVFYLPVVLYSFYLMYRHRSISVFTCANPAIPAGGFLGESKADIYSGLFSSPAAASHSLEYIVLDPERDDAWEMAMDFAAARETGFPLVLKPDTGERGKDVRIIRDRDSLKKALEAAAGRQILQEFASGDEFSIFYYRYPGEPFGRIFSVTEKVFPEINGDGRSTIEELILNDRRAVSIAPMYLDALEDDPERVPAPGEKIRLIEIGTHSRGAIFRDGGHIVTESLERVIDEICRGYEGFYFGRFDLRTGSIKELKEGRGFKIVELNGVTSESTNIYDPRYSLFDAYRILFRQWKIAFEIGGQNLNLGARPASASELVSLIFGGRPDHERGGSE